jgi:hypothetical protein
VIANPEVVRCSEEEWAEFRRMALHGMLFEIIKWIDDGRPTLRPLKKHTTAFGDAVAAPNLSLTQVLWERAWQDRAEAVSVLGSLACNRNSIVVMRYLLEHGCPVDHVTGFDLCLFHHLDLIRIGMARGVNILEPDGWAAAFVHVGSHPLIRFYIEERERIPGLKRDAVQALCRCIEDSRLRAVGLLKWAGVDPFAKAPRYNSWEDPEEEWDGFPALRLSQAKKAGELLNLLKLKPGVGEWFQLLECMASGSGDDFASVYNLVKDPDSVIMKNPALSEALLRRLLSSIGWGWSWNPARSERLVGLCFRLMELGISLRWKEKDAIHQFRRDVFRWDSKADVFKVLSMAATVADDQSRADLAELVRTPKMRELVISHDARILSRLGIPGPADYLDIPTAREARMQRKPREVRVDPPESEVTISVHRPTSEVGSGRAKDPVIPPHAIKRRGGRVISREEIYGKLWSAPACHVAGDYGISGSMLARICTKLDVPRPLRGYWARPDKWRKAHQPPLPEWKGGDADYWVVNPGNVKAQRLVTRTASGETCPSPLTG